jgi:hypothetical protein
LVFPNTALEKYVGLEQGLSGIRCLIKVNVKRIAYIARMRMVENIESIGFGANEPNALRELKSRYNRYASRLNFARHSFWKKEHTVLYKELTLLKIKIDTYL